MRYEKRKGTLIRRAVDGRQIWAMFWPNIGECWRLLGDVSLIVLMTFIFIYFRLHQFKNIVYIRFIVCVHIVMVFTLILHSLDIRFT